MTTMTAMEKMRSSITPSCFPTFAKIKPTSPRGAMPTPTTMLPPTSAALGDDRTRPYFLWWTDATVGDLRRHLQSEDVEERAYWLGALLREANTRDVWLFVRPDEIRALWPSLIRHLGRSRSMWAGAPPWCSRAS